jgi:hypothetical protein
MLKDVGEKGSQLIDRLDRRDKGKRWTADVAVLILMLHMNCTEAYGGISRAVRAELGNVAGRSKDEKYI